MKSSPAQFSVIAILSVLTLSSASALNTGEQAIPDFAATQNVGWIASGMGFGTDFVQPPSGGTPGPATLTAEALTP